MVNIYEKKRIIFYYYFLLVKNNGILKLKINRMLKLERYKWKLFKCIVEKLMFMYRYKRIYYMGGWFFISLGGFYVGVLFD